MAERRRADWWIPPVQVLPAEARLAGAAQAVKQESVDTDTDLAKEIAAVDSSSVALAVRISFGAVLTVTPRSLATAAMSSLFSRRCLAATALSSRRSRICRLCSYAVRAATY